MPFVSLLVLFLLSNQVFIQAHNCSQESSKIENTSVSVVILNWRRPDNVKKIINQMEEYPEVSEILVLMCLESTKFQASSYKITSLDFTLLESQWGLTSRFRGCQIASSPWVLIVDDDLIVTRTGLRRLIFEKQKTPDRLIAIWGRDYDEREPQYVAREVAANSTAKIALTRAMLLDSRFCHGFFQFSHLMEAFAKESHVYWNGEDIFMSLVSSLMTSQNPFIIGDDATYYKNVNSDHYRHIGISLGKNHLSYRNKFLITALDRLSCK